MAGPDGQKAPKTSGKICRTLTSGLVYPINNVRLKFFCLIGYLMLGSILSFISLMLLVMSFAR